MSNVETRTDRRVRSFKVALLAAALAAGSTGPAGPESAPAQAPAPAMLRAKGAFGSLPLGFEANLGQTDEQVRFLSRGPGYTLFLTPTEAVLRLGNGAKEKSALPAVLRMQTVGANPSAQMGGREELPGKVSYFRGRESSKWRKGIPTYSQVGLRDVYRGIDLVYYGNQRQLEYDFIVHPGADPQAIRLALQGADQINIDEKGDLVLRVGRDEVRLLKPVVYQEVAGSRREIPGSYVRRGNEEVGFEVAEYDRSRALVIDPIVAFSTYLGGGQEDVGMAIAVDAAGSVYITGWTWSVDFPTVNPVQGARAGTNRSDAFVTKLDPTGSSLVYSTYLGGSNPYGDDKAFGIAVDPAGFAYVVGGTFSSDFPTTPGAVQPQDLLSLDGFAAKLDPSGSTLVYSTYLGGSLWDQALGVAVDADGNAYVTGESYSADLPVANALQPQNAGSSDAFVIKLAPDGSAFEYATYLGGRGTDTGTDIAVDGSGHAYVTGVAASGDFPVTAGALQKPVNGDVFVAKLEASGSALVYGAVFGGSNPDEGRGIAVDDTGRAYVAGLTWSTNFPVMNAFQSVAGSGQHGFVAALDPAGSALFFSSYIGGTGRGAAASIAVNSLGHIYVTGRTESLNLPVTADALYTTCAAGHCGPYLDFIISDGFVARIDPSRTGFASLVFSTFLGGSDGGNGYGIAADSAGIAYVTGFTWSADFPIVNAFQPAKGGGRDAFVMKLETGVIIPQEASFDPALQAPKCALVAASCDSGTLLNGRGPVGPEPNQPNTISDSCADGTTGGYHSDESNDHLKVSTVDGTLFAPGKTVRIDATVWAWPAGPSYDKLDLYYTVNANSPNWAYITTLTPSGGGVQTLSATYTLASGPLQAVRARFRYNGTASPCSPGGFTDHDDLVFAVNSGPPDTIPPTTTVTSPASGATVSGTVTVTASASDDVGVAKVEFYVDNSLQGTDTTAPYQYAWNTGAFTNGSHTLRSQAYDAANNMGASAVRTVTVNNPPPIIVAVYDPVLRAPKCSTVGGGCDSASLLIGRGGIGPEPNQPNTINTCLDGTAGAYHVDESMDRLRVVTTDGSALAAGKQVTIHATVWAWSTPSLDRLDIYYTANASSPAWTLLTTLTPTVSGAQTLTATYTLPAGSLQAVRAQMRYQGTASACTAGSFNDRDDLIFAVP